MMRKDYYFDKNRSHFLSLILLGIVDCSAYEKNAVKLKHSLDFYRCMNAKMWSTSPFILRQIDGIGVQMAKTLSQKNISSFEQLRDCDPGRLEMVSSPLKKKIYMELIHFTYEIDPPPKSPLWHKSK